MPIEKLIDALRALPPGTVVDYIDATFGQDQEVDFMELRSSVCGRIRATRGRLLMAVALYARVSSGPQNIELQLDELRNWCIRHGWKVYHEYVDHGISGAKCNRPALNQLMDDARARRFDCVLVYKLDRFGRSVVDLVNRLGDLEKYRVRFIATSQGIDTDYSSPTSRLQLQILSAVAEFERELIRERTLLGIEAAKRNGAQFGRPKAIFSIDKARELRAKGLTWSQVAESMKLPVGTIRNAFRREELRLSSKELDIPAGPTVLDPNT